MRLAVAILAAGQGTRMRSRIPKVLHRVAGRPMLEYSLRAAAELGAARKVVVVGHGGEQVLSAIPSEVESVVQEPQLGTGHALAQAGRLLEDACDQILVLYGDMPLLRPETLQALIAARGDAPASVLVTHLADPTGYGRIKRAADGKIISVVEEVECTPAEKMIREVNCGIYCFDAAWIWEELEILPRHTDGEYYLTDIVEAAAREGKPVVGMELADADEATGVNHRVHLARAEAIMRQRIRDRLMLSGVTMIDPATTFIDDSVRIGLDTTIYPNTLIEGNTDIGEDCTIGPGSRVVSSQIGSGCVISASLIEESILESGVQVGPFCHVRSGSHLGVGVYLGNYAEVKNSRLGPGTQMHHFSYVGDATVGEGVNIAAGVVTCNFNSETQVKSRTEIGDGAAVGSDTMLVAPVRVGKGAITGAGSVVTRDIPAGTAAWGAPAKPVRKVHRQDHENAASA